MARRGAGFVVGISSNCSICSVNIFRMPTLEPGSSLPVGRAKIGTAGAQAPPHLGQSPECRLASPCPPAVPATLAERLEVSSFWVSSWRKVAKSPAKVGHLRENSVTPSASKIHLSKEEKEAFLGKQQQYHLECCQGSGLQQEASSMF